MWILFKQISNAIRQSLWSSSSHGPGLDLNQNMDMFCIRTWTWMCIQMLILVHTHRKQCSFNRCYLLWELDIYLDGHPICVTTSEPASDMDTESCLHSSSLSVVLKCTMHFILQCSPFLVTYSRNTAFFGYKSSNVWIKAFLVFPDYLWGLLVFRIGLLCATETFFWPDWSSFLISVSCFVKKFLGIFVVLNQKTALVFPTLL